MQRESTSHCINSEAKETVHKSSMFDSLHLSQGLMIRHNARSITVSILLSTTQSSCLDIVGVRSSDTEDWCLVINRCGQVPAPHLVILSFASNVNRSSKNVSLTVSVTDYSGRQPATGHITAGFSEAH